MMWIGILLAIIASMTGTIGKQCFRLSQLQSDKGTRSGDFLAKVSLASGFFLNVAVGPFVDMGSYAFAPQSIIAPLAGLDVVWNTLSAPCTLGEQLTLPVVLGCVLIAGGATGTSFFGSQEDKMFDIETLRKTILRTAVLVYMLALVGWLAFNIIFLIPRSAAPRGQPFKTGDKWRGLSLGMTAGSISGNMFCTKAFVEVVQASFNEGHFRYWFDWLPWVLGVGAVFFATSNLYFLATAMREYDALFMGAVFEGTLIIAACISGVVVFSELEALPAWQIAVYWTGVSGVIGGIFVVAYGCMTGTDAVQDLAAAADPEQAPSSPDVDPPTPAHSEKSMGSPTSRMSTRSNGSARSSKTSSRTITPEFVTGVPWLPCFRRCFKL
mmetsp:Transcript_21975/g.66031  ORF Transcript_21975/g.66031 Transcript_21975/m.66031 type:complete len:382 (+) Transcript_21975:168-1313(+)